MAEEPFENPYSPSSNFFRAWAKSENGRWIYVGLTEDETDELLTLQGSALEGDEIVIVEMDLDLDHLQRDRYLELHNKHERVRLEVCSMYVRGFDS